MKDEAEENGGYIDPSEVPNGALTGQWSWLNPPIDQPIADALPNDMDGANPLEKTIALEAGRLSELARSRLPIAVYYPNHQYLNPSRRPTGGGVFRYLTEGPGSSRDLARINLGGQRHFEANNDPSAEDIFNYRRMIHGRIANGLEDDDADQSTEIDIVWCPDEVEGSPPGTPHPSPSPAPADYSDTVCKHSGLPQDPTNPDIPDFDQTHEGKLSSAYYQTIQLENGKIVTVDRSRAHAGDPEPKKLKFINKKGTTRMYPHKFDWNDNAAVEKLNKAREQAMERAGFPPKRPDPRENYTAEERKWMWDKYVKRHKGDRPPGISMGDITDDFNKQFPGGNRNLGGITGLIDRQRKKLKDEIKKKEELRAAGKHSHDDTDSESELSDEE